MVRDHSCVFVVSLTRFGAGGYCVVFAGSIWVLVKRRRAAESQPVSYVIDGCSWFIFVTLTIVSYTSSVLYWT
jgi:hypothetical protein